MAERRMFAKSIVLSDAFLDMPQSARCLYFTLGMLADDDGFIGSVKSIMRQCGASEDDLKVLLAKRFVLDFDSGVLVIKHWRLNNYLRSDRYRATDYIDEKKLLEVKENGAYTYKTDWYTNGIPSIGKDSIGKNSIEDNMSVSPPVIPSENNLVETNTDDEQHKENSVSTMEVECQKILDYLSQQVNAPRGYKLNHSRKRTMKARFDEGYKVDDFYIVINNKVAQWLNDSKMKQYLTPETLFAPSHFDKYLNETPVENVKKDIQVTYDSSKNKPITQEELDAIKKYREGN